MASLRPINGFGNAPSFNAARSMAVSSSSAKTQFDKWLQEKETFAKQAEAAKRQCSDLEQKTNKLQAEQDELRVKIRLGNNKVGNIVSSIKTLEQHKERLAQQLHVEKQQNKECQDEILAMEAAYHKNKREYCELMASASGEWGRLLNKYDYIRLKHMITTETVLVFADPKFMERVAGKPEVQQDLEAAIGMLKEATADYEQAKMELDDSHQRLLDARTIVKDREPVRIPAGSMHAIAFIAMPLTLLALSLIVCST